MANTAVYTKNGKQYFDKDPDDQLFYVLNVAADLADSATTAVSYTLITSGVTVLQQAAPQGTNGSLLAIKVGALTAVTGDPFITARVVCANGEQFDRTVYFNSVDN